MYSSAIIGLLMVVCRHVSSLKGYKGEPRSYNLVLTTTQKLGASFDISKGFREKTEVPDQIEAELSVNGLKSLRLSLNRQRLMAVPSRTEMSENGVVKKSEKYENEDVYFYTSTEGSGSFACELKKKRSGRYVCQMSALISTGNYSCYIGVNTENADCTPTEIGERRVYKNRSEFGKVTKESIIPHQERVVMMQNKSTTYELPQPGYKTVEIVMLVDGKFMELFYARNSDTNAAKQEVTIYMALLSNEINVFYDSVRAATAGNLAVFVYPTTVIYPNPGGNWAWSAGHVIAGVRLDASRTMDSRLFAQVRRILREWDSDHVMAFTGYDLYQGSYNLLGYAYLSTVCSSAQNKYSLVEFRSVDPSATCAHELAHALSLQHDEDVGCQPGTYIMSQQAFPVTSITRDTYNTFSSCSISYMRNYLNNNRLQQCTTNNGFTNEQFQELFCRGFLGNQQNTLDLQCQRRTDYSGSVACGTVTDQNSGCYSPGEVRCKTQTNLCTVSLRHVWNGTPCGNNKVCFKGRCVDNFDVCSNLVVEVENTTTSEIGQASTTKEMTTTTTTITTTTTSEMGQASTTTAPDPFIPDAPCQCCGFKRDKRRRRCCRKGLRRQKEDCYCCGDLLDIEPPEGFDGPQY